MTSEQEAAEFAMRRAELLVEMAKMAEGLSDETRKLRADVRSLKRSRRLAEVVIIALVGFLLFAGAVLWQVHGLQRRNTRILTREQNVRVMAAGIQCAFTNFRTPDQIETCIQQHLGGKP